MNGYVNVNGVQVPVIRNSVNAMAKLMGIKRGSIIIIADDCMISFDMRKYLKSKNVKIVTVN